jgi:hypothetical protein
MLVAPDSNELISSRFPFSVAFMSSVTEIQAALPNLTVEELRAIDSAVRAQFRARKVGILYDDSYGVWTEDDQTSAAAEVFAML